MSNYKHGDARKGNVSQLHCIWRGMKKRCRRAKNYCDRGIYVCSEWLNDYVAFRDWALANGYQDGLQIDRIDNDGPYSPSNCRFVTAQVNGSNKRNNIYVEAFGERKTTAEWSRDSRCTVTVSSLRERLRDGMLPEMAITKPARRW